MKNLIRCFVPTDKQHPQTESSLLCCRQDLKCKERAIYHVNYGTGCGNFCEKHEKKITKLRTSSQVVSVNRWYREVVT